MQKKLWIVTIILFSFVSIQAQESSNVVMHEPGWMSVTAGLKVGSINGGDFGGMIGGKYHFTRKSAIRFGLEGSKINSSNNTEFSGRSADDVLEKANLYGGFVDYLYYIQSVKPVKLYLGGGPTFGKYNRLYKHYNPSHWPVLDDDYESSYNQWYIGFDGKVGLEWLATSNFGISIEYSISYKYFEGDYDSYYVIEKGSHTENGWEKIYDVIQKSGTESSSNVYANQFLLGFNIYL